MAVDAFGNIFIAVWGSSFGLIRKVGLNGIITTVAGNGTNGYSGDGGLATNASLYTTGAVAVDGFGNLFIAEGHRIREVGIDGIISTVAGNGAAAYSGDSGPATNASLYYPEGVAVDGFGNLFIADSSNNRIREVIAGGPTLSLSNVGVNNAGNYDVIVTSPFGSVTSDMAVLTVGAGLRAALLDGNILRLELSGAPDQNYILQSTSSLNSPINWQPISTNETDASGKVIFTHSISPAQSAVFYRVAAP